MSTEGPAGPAVKVFISYSRQDTQATAWTLYLRLEQQFGAQNVFFDHGTLQPGMRWFEEIEGHLRTGGVLLALIGEKWASIRTSHLQRGEDDYVVKEIDLALRSSPATTVIPVLVDEASLPDSRVLSPAMRDIRYRQVERLRTSSLLSDIDRLIRRIVDLQQEPQRAVRPLETLPPARKPSARAASATGRVAPAPDEDHYRMVVQHAGNLVVFLGSAPGRGEGTEPWSVGCGIAPSDRDLTRYLASEAGLAGAPSHLAEVAEFASAIHGEMELFQWVRHALRTDGGPGQVERYLAGLPATLGKCQMIVTPKYDATLEQAFREENQEFDVALYMAPRTEYAGRIIHLAWEGQPKTIEKPNEYTGFPIVAEDQSMLRTVILRISGAVDDPSAGFPWEDNYVITEDHYIDYLGGHSAEEVIPTQILAKLQKSSYLFLGYTIADWRLRVFLHRIFKGPQLGHAKYWAVEENPDQLERELWHQIGVTRLYQASLDGYLEGLYSYLSNHPVGVRS